MVAKSYIGITGPVSVEETTYICQEFLEAGYSLGSPHIPMIGFLVSHKTLNGLTVQNRRYPSIAILPELLKATDSKVLTMIHYNSRAVDSLSDQVARIFEDIYDTGLCRAIQLNIAWPDINQVARIKDNHPDMKIVFQASHLAMEDKTPHQIARGIKNYGDSLSYVLIDPSGGRGLSFDIESSMDLYSELKEKCPSLTVGFAGGFTWENTSSRLDEIVRRTGREDFCIDAEGGLRDKMTPAYGDDILNMEKVRGYLQSASSVLR